MKKRVRISSSVLGIAAAILVSAPIFVYAQSSSGTVTSSPKATPKTAGKTTANPAANTQSWVTPRMADGHPDFGGYWNNLTFTPLERPAKYGNREFLTPDEMKAVFKSGVKGSFDPGAQGSEDRYGGELFN